MADQLFQRRKARSKHDLRRKKARRDSYDRVLIVCEGSKSEPEYFRNWCDSLKLNSANIEVVGDCGSDPLSVVNHGIERCNEDGEFDRVFCVFDKDTHKTYDDAVRKLNGQDSSRFTAIRSVPCFEYWLLLHFEYSTQPFTTAQALAAVRAHISGYKKGYSEAAIATFNNVDQAIMHARRARTQGVSEGFELPYTNVDELITYLKFLKS